MAFSCLSENTNFEWHNVIDAQIAKTAFVSNMNLLHLGRIDCMAKYYRKPMPHTPINYLFNVIRQINKSPLQILYWNTVAEWYEYAPMNWIRMANQYTLWNKFQ